MCRFIFSSYPFTGFRFLLSAMLIAVLVLSLPSCKKKDQGQTIEPIANILSKSAHIVDSTVIISLEDHTLTMDKEAMDFTPAVGDIIMASPSRNAPVGVFAKISKIIADGMRASYLVEPTSLNEAFDQLYIDYTFSASTQRNTLMKNTAALYEIPVNYLITPKISLTGKFVFNLLPGRIHYVKKPGSSMPDTVEIKTGLNTSGSFLSLVAEQTTETIEEKRIYTYNKMPIIWIPVPVGTVVWVMPFWQNVALNTLPFTFSGRGTFSIYPEADAILWMRYVNGNFQNLSSTGFKIKCDDPKKPDFDVKAHAALTLITPVYNIGPLYFQKMPDSTKNLDATSSLHGFFKLPNIIEAKIDKDNIPNYRINYKLNIEAGLHYDFWLGIKGEKSVTLELIDKKVKEGSWCYAVGDTLEGGLVCYVDSTGCHGLICAFEDQATDARYTTKSESELPIFYRTDWIWGSTRFTDLYDNRKIGIGAANSDSILTCLGNADNVAFSCSTYKKDGYSGWYLPSLNELMEIYLHRDKIPNLTKGRYWSSTAGGYSNSPCYVEGIDFSNGTAFEESCAPWLSYTPGNVRAVKKF